MKILIGTTVLIAGIGLVGGMGLSPAAAEDSRSKTHQLVPQISEVR